MPAANRPTRGAVWCAVLALLAPACGQPCSHLDHSLDRAEELLVLLEAIEDETDAEATAPDVADWVARWELHNHRTAGFEAVSGATYVTWIESRRSRTADLRTRLRRQLDRLPEEPALERYEAHVSSALALLPPAMPE